MERLQIILLVFISSSWFLTCDKESQKQSNWEKTENSSHFKKDSTLIAMNIRNADFYSEWLSLPFSGSGSNWMATVNFPEFSDVVFNPLLLTVYMKKSDSIYKLTYKGGEGDIDYGIDNGTIAISSGFNPGNIEFMYVISRDGTFVKEKFIDTNYTAKLK